MISKKGKNGCFTINDSKQQELGQNRHKYVQNIMREQIKKQLG